MLNGHSSPTFSKNPHIAQENHRLSGLLRTWDEPSSSKDAPHCGFPRPLRNVPTQNPGLGEYGCHNLQIVEARMRPQRKMAAKKQPNASVATIHLPASTIWQFGMENQTWTHFGLNLFPPQLGSLLMPETLSGCRFNWAQISGSNRDKFIACHKVNHMCQVCSNPLLSVLSSHDWWVVNLHISSYILLVDVEHHGTQEWWRVPGLRSQQLLRPARIQRLHEDFEWKKWK